MSRPSSHPSTVPVYSHTKQYLFHASPDEAKSLIRSGAIAKRSRHRKLVGIIQSAPKPLPSKSNESPCSIPNRHIRINAGVEEVSIGMERYVRRRVDLFNPALSEVRAQAIKYVTREELAALKEPMLPCLKRALERGV